MVTGTSLGWMNDDCVGRTYNQISRDMSGGVEDIGSLKWKGRYFKAL